MDEQRERDEARSGPAGEPRSEAELTTADLAGPRPSAAGAEQARGEPGATPLFSSDEAQGFRSRWQEIQAGFVDEPRQAVEKADSLVAEVMKQLAQSFADERSKLETQWDRGDATETEDLRLAFRRYRSFFDRLLSV